MGHDRPVAAVTGATGFLGRFIVRALDAAGFHVRILARRDPAHPLFDGLFLETVPGDIADEAALRRLVAGADAVIHAAGLIKAASRADFFSVNEGGSTRLGRAVADAAPAARLVAVSSLAAREPSLSHYAASKRAGEAALVAAAGVDDWVVVRPPAIYGPWDRETLALFRAAAGPVVPILGPETTRLALIQVEDAAAAVAALARPGPRGTVLELADERPEGYGWTDMIDAAVAAVGGSPRRVRVPAFILSALGGAGSCRAWLTGKPVMLTRGKVREIRHPDWSVARDRLPPAYIWRPRIGLRDGFSATANWYRSQGWLPRRSG